MQVYMYMYVSLDHVMIPEALRHDLAVKIPRPTALPSVLLTWNSTILLGESR